MGVTSVSKFSIKIVALIFFFAFMQSVNPAEANSEPQVTDGVLDLTEWNWDLDGVASLDGEWEFYWDQLLTPDDFNKGNLTAEKAFITVPMTWNGFTLDDEQITGKGAATYRLKVQTLNEQPLAMKIPKIFTTFDIWVNQELITTYRTSGNSRHYPKVLFFNPDKNTIEFIFQITNDRHRSGGIVESIQLGTPEQINNMIVRNVAFDLFLFGCLFIIGIYHLTFYLYRKKERSALYFGVFSLLVSMRTLFVGEMYIIHLFPNIHWEFGNTIHTLTYYLAVPVFMLLLKSLFPNDVSRNFVTFTQFFGLSLALLVILTPTNIFTYVNPIYQLFTLVVIAYVFTVLYSVCSKKREGAYMITLGTAILCLLAINDIIFLSVVFMDSENMFLKNIFTRGDLAPWGLLAFVFVQSVVLAKKISKSFTKLEVLTQQYQQLNESLEEKVEERTSALEISNKELEQAYQAISRSEKARQHLVQNVSHDLRTPLTSIQGYVSAVVDDVVKEREQQKKYLRRVLDKVTSLDHLVQQLTELSKLEARQIKLDFSLVSVKDLMDKVLERHLFDVESSKVMFHVDYPSEWKVNPVLTEQVAVNVNFEQLNRVFTNLLSNALKFTPEWGQIELSFRIVEANEEVACTTHLDAEKSTCRSKRLLIKVTDTGTGIPKEEVPYIFERFYKVGKARQTITGSSGLGLAITKEIIEYHGGEIGVDSELGKGCHVYFTLPIVERVIDQ